MPNDLQKAAWLKRPELPTEDYPLGTVLPHAVKSRKRINYTTWAGVIVLALYLLSWLLFR